MGADGHIIIYDVEKLESKYSDEVLEIFYKEFMSSITYRQKLKDNEYITRYYGDNLYLDDLWDYVRTRYINVEDKFQDKYKDEWECVYFMKEFSKARRKQFREIIDFLEDECRITSWEVWT